MADEVAIFALDELRDERRAAGALALEFLRSAALSATIYELAAGSEDPQRPHSEDEVYCVVAGRARFESAAAPAGGGRDVGPGDVIYVRAGAQHRFVDIAEDLTVLVVFAPPEAVPVEP